MSGQSLTRRGEGPNPSLQNADAVLLPRYIINEHIVSQQYPCLSVDPVSYCKRPVLLLGQFLDGGSPKGASGSDLGDPVVVILPVLHHDRGFAVGKLPLLRLQHKLGLLVQVSCPSSSLGNDSVFCLTRFIIAIEQLSLLPILSCSVMCALLKSSHIPSGVWQNIGGGEMEGNIPHIVCRVFGDIFHPKVRLLSKEVTEMVEFLEEMTYKERLKSKHPGPRMPLYRSTGAVKAPVLLTREISPVRAALCAQPGQAHAGGRARAGGKSPQHNRDLWMLHLQSRPQAALGHCH